MKLSGGKRLLFKILLLFFSLNLSSFAGLGGKDAIDEFITTVNISGRVILLRTGVTYFDAVTAVATEKGIVVFDAGCSPSLTARYKNIIESEFKRNDFVYLVNTHSHWDHTNGNGVFPETVVIGYENCKNELLNNYSDREQFLSRLNGFRDRSLQALQTNNADTEMGRQLKCRAEIYSLAIDDFKNDFNCRTPGIMFHDKLSLDMGDITLNMVYFGRAHSESDIMIYIPEEKLLMSGDLFNCGGSGNLSKLNHNEVGKEDVERWYKALTFILDPDNKIEKVIDGHGAVLEYNDLLSFYNIVGKLWRDFNSGRVLSAKARLIQVFKESGLEAMLAEYRMMSGPKKDNYYFYEGEFIDQAGHMVGDREIKGALEILKINVEKNPDSWNAYDCLGEVYMLDGNKELAVENYRKSLELNPNNENTRVMLRKLEDN